MQVLARKFGTLLSSYTRALNKQEDRNGSLFRRKTKAKDLWEYITYPKNRNDYLQTCFFYIHNNPVAAQFVKKAKDWKYSSFPDFLGLRKGTLCNIELALELIDVERENLNAYINIDFGNIENIW